MPRIVIRAAAALVVAGFGLGCEPGDTKPPGEACHWVGHGYAAAHDCGAAALCIQVVICGSEQREYNRCATQCGEGGTCPAGFECRSFDANGELCVAMDACN